MTVDFSVECTAGGSDRSSPNLRSPLPSCCEVGQGLDVGPTADAPKFATTDISDSMVMLRGLDDPLMSPAHDTS